MDVQEKDWPSYASLSSHRAPPHMYSVPPSAQLDPMHAPPPVDIASNLMYKHEHQHLGSTSSSVSSSVAYMPPSKTSPIRRSYPGFSMSQPTTPRPGSPASPQTVEGDPKQNYNYFAGPHGAIRRRRKESELPHHDSPPFGSTKYNKNLYAHDRSTILDVRLLSKVDRGFFMADNDWTCYRRNYFQVSSAFSIQGVDAVYEGQELPCLIESDGTLHPVQQFFIGISSRVANSEKQIMLVQHTPKRDKGPQTIPEPKSIQPGGSLAITTVTSQAVVSFERVQFKSATANNGKRRAAQQYYVLITELYGKLDSGRLVPVAHCVSSPLVVRGRSPGHYADSDASGKRVRQESTSHEEQGSTSSRHSQSPFPNHTGFGIAPPPTDNPTYAYPAYSSFGPMPPSMPDMVSASSPTPQQSYATRPFVPGTHDRTQSGEASSTHSDVYGNENNHPRYQQPRVPTDDYWARVRMASNTSHTSVGSSHSPYMNAPPSDSYYSQPVPSYSPNQMESPHHHHHHHSHLHQTHSHPPSSPYQTTAYDARTGAAMDPSHLPPSSAASDRGYPAAYSEEHWRHDTNRPHQTLQSHQGMRSYEGDDGNGTKDVGRVDHGHEGNVALKEKHTHNTNK